MHNINVMATDSADMNWDSPIPDRVNGNPSSDISSDYIDAVSEQAHFPAFYGNVYSVTLEELDNLIIEDTSQLDFLISIGIDIVSYILTGWPGLVVSLTATSCSYLESNELPPGTYKQYRLRIVGEYEQYVYGVGNINTYYQYDIILVEKQIGVDLSYVVYDEQYVTWR